MKYINKKIMESIHEEIKNNNIIITEFDNLNNQPSVGYCYNINFDFIIKIYSGIKNMDTYDFILAHEVRHVSHGHFHPCIKDITLNNITKIIKNKIKAMTDELKKAIGQNNKQIVNNLFNYFYNIAADMEVNSKLIEDYNIFVKQTDELMSNILDINSYMNNLKNDIVYGVHPSNLKELYGVGNDGKPLSFPTKMDFIYYMEELVKNVDFNSLQANVVNSKSNEAINKDGDKQRDLESFKESNNKQQKCEIDSLNSKVHEEYKMLIKEYTIYNNLRKYILKNIRKDILTDKKNILYNYNRRKFSYDYNQTLIPKYKTHIDDGFTNIVIVADVSGSMSDTIINNIVNTIFKMKIPNKLFKLITWDTELVEEFDIKNKAPLDIKSGGGTNIANSFPYVNKYLNNESMLFIISDLEDDIEEWKCEMKKLHIPESNIFIIDVNNYYNNIALKLFKNYYNLFVDKK